MASEMRNGTEICTNYSFKNSKNHEELSGLAKIEIKSENPMDLFTEWHNDAIKFSAHKPNAACLATVSKDFKISARHLQIRHYDQRGFLFVTDNRSLKSEQLAEVPNAAMCILWAYRNEHDEKISRQVRMDGKMEELSPEEFRFIYDKEPLCFRIRSHLCHQGKEVDWNEHKNYHDKLYQEASTGKIDLPMPDHYIGYRLVPDTFDYYYAYDHFIADRLLFIKEDGKWTHKRIAA